MLQEVFTNTIKHSKATELEVELNYRKETLEVIAKDNGIGFNYAQARALNGIGLTNIEARGKLIGATIAIASQEGKGTRLRLTYTPNAL